MRNLLDSDDITYMLGALETLGVSVVRKSPTEVEVTGVGGPLPVPDVGKEVELDLGNAGTAMRPLCAALSFSDIGEGGVRLDGIQRMRERPIEDLIDGLKQLGTNAMVRKREGGRGEQESKWAYLCVSL